MYSFYASVNFGLESIVSEILKKLGARDVTALESAVTFRSEKPVGAGCINNLFYVLHAFRSGSIAQALTAVSGREFDFGTTGGKKAATFRVVLMDCGKLVPAPGKLLSRVEADIARQTRMRPFRAKPDVEFWLLRRADGRTFFLRRYEKHAPFDKTLRRGELRPDVVNAMLYTADIKPGQTLLDPFGGSGAIAAAALKSFCSDVITGDIDPDCVGYQKNRLSSYNSCKILRLDALKLPLDDRTIDAVVTDPPWGEFAPAGESGKVSSMKELYSGFVREAYRVLKPGGTLVFLSSAADIASAALKAVGLLYEAYPLKIGGKEALLFSSVRAKNFE